MSLIGDTKLEILRALENEELHGYALHQRLGITASTIYAHLSELENAGMVTHRQETIQGRERQVYSLTEDGQKLLDLLTNE